MSDKYSDGICPTVRMLFDDNEIKMARKPVKKQKENPVGCTGEGKRWKGNIREGSREVRREPSWS